MRKSKYKIGDEVLWVNPPNDRTSSNKSVGIITDINAELGYIVIFAGKFRRAYFLDHELERATKLHKALL